MYLPPLPYALDLWLPAWLRRSDYGLTPLGARHLVLCICDHYDPFPDRNGTAPALAQLEAWRTGLADFAEHFRDSGGFEPRHTFFYPVEQYEAALVEKLAALCHETGSEAEIRLHHSHDSAENLRATLLQARERFANHGLLARDESGAVRYGFIHGDGALDNSAPFGHGCGVSGELAILHETGCLADFTLPTVPRRSQTRTINSLYYARSGPAPKSHDRGRRVRADRAPEPPRENELLIVQGPLSLNWQRRHWGFLPGVEHGELTAANPPTAGRLDRWLDCRISVQGRPGWIFAKLHTYGGCSATARSLLGEPMREFHRLLARRAEDDASFHYHYVTARELVNILHAAEAGHSGDPCQFRDYRYKSLVPAEHQRRCARS